MTVFLVATDLSERSARAFRRTISLNKKQQGSIRLLHVVDSDQPASVVDAQKNRARQYLEQMVAEEDCKGQVVEIVVEAGEPHTVINDYAAQSGAALVIVGAHRKNLLLDLLRGTTIERVLRTGSTPVLVCNLRHNTRHDPVLCGIDLDSNAINAIRTAFELKLLDESRITLAHAYTSLSAVQMAAAGRSDTDIEEQLLRSEAKLAEDIYQLVSDTPLADRDYRLVIEEAPAPEMLMRLAGRMEAALIVVGTRSSTTLERLFLGSTAKAILRQGQGDILAVPPRLQHEKE